MKRDCDQLDWIFHVTYTSRKGNSQYKQLNNGIVRERMVKMPVVVVSAIVYFQQRLNNSSANEWDINVCKEVLYTAKNYLVAIV